MFRPGRSGNPDGRPKALKEVEELARERIPAAIAALAHIAEHFDSDQARVAAANALLDRRSASRCRPTPATTRRRRSVVRRTS
jgi:hypothetical protein